MVCRRRFSGESLVNPHQNRFQSLRKVDFLSEDFLTLERETTQAPSNASQLAVLSCTGCGEPIRGRVALQVGKDQPWHRGCLHCEECHCPLGESASCFLRDGRILCRTDYAQLFAEKCRVCGDPVLSSDLVVKAGGQIYHPDCLHCSVCGSLLMPGDSFTLGPQGLCCQPEHTMPEQQIHNGAALRRIKGPRTRRRRGVWEWCMDGGRSVGGRVRTVLSESQLRILCTCYSQTPRPDAALKLQLSHLTGLSQRVIRVWFQNKRCKDKKSQTKRAARPAGEVSTLLSAAVRPMVALPPEAPRPALHIHIYQSSWHPVDDQIKNSSCSSEDLHSPQQYRDDDF